ncbi:MAG TPA: 2'-5' RNA ligase family protein [Pararhizobium sp.]|nr:2'-5' RNA ligase family protein [Pararhizobium sp.]
MFEFCRNLPVRPARPERLFFGVFPDAEAAGRINKSAARLFGEGRFEETWIRTDRLHLSLHHIGDYKHLPTKLIYAARQAGGAVWIEPFEMTFDAVGSYEGTPTNGTRRRPVAMLGGAKALLSLHEALGRAMKKNGLRPAVHFTPHLTLFYSRKPFPARPIEPIRFTANEFALVYSKLGLTEYELIERWPLKA